MDLVAKATFRWEGVITRSRDWSVLSRCLVECVPFGLGSVLLKICC